MVLWKADGEPLTGTITLVIVSRSWFLGHTGTRPVLLCIGTSATIWTCLYGTHLYLTMVPELVWWGSQVTRTSLASPGYLREGLWCLRSFTIVTISCPSPKTKREDQNTMEKSWRTFSNHHTLAKQHWRQNFAEIC